MTLFDLLRSSALRLLAQSVRQSQSNPPRFRPSLTELERRETPAAPDWLSDVGIQSAGLGLTGKGIGLGPIELGRPALARQAPRLRELLRRRVRLTT
jgi:hypothetical protein